MHIIVSNVWTYVLCIRMSACMCVCSLSIEYSYGDGVNVWRCLHRNTSRLESKISIRILLFSISVRERWFVVQHSHANKNNIINLRGASMKFTLGSGRVELWTGAAVSRQNIYTPPAQRTFPPITSSVEHFQSLCTVFKYPYRTKQTQLYLLA